MVTECRETYDLMSVRRSMNYAYTTNTNKETNIVILDIRWSADLCSLKSDWFSNIATRAVKGL